MNDRDRLHAWRARLDAVGLEFDDVDADPIEACRNWLSAARAAGVFEADAATLATVDAAGNPAARAVLVRGIDQRGFVFYTNTTSAKAQALAATGRASLHFLWAALRRQIRIDGRAERVDDAESDAYFASRPRDRQLAAWASDQSAVVASRAELDAAFAAQAERFGSGPIPRPANWGGYRLVPTRIELWQGRESRLHDRLCYDRADGGWTRSRLAP